MKKLLLIVVLVAILAVSACATTTPEADEPPNFLFVSPQVGQEGWGTVLAAAEEALPECNATMDVAGSTNQDVAEMISALEAGFTGGYDGVWTHCISPEAFTPIINKYADAGIPVICVADDAPYSKRLTFIGSVEFVAGQTIGEFVVEATGGEAKVGILTGVLGQPSLEVRINGIKDAFADEPGIEIVDIQADEGDLLTGVAAVHAMLLANPDIDVLMGTEGWAPQSIGLALQEEGKAPGEILATGWDAESKTIEFIEDGTLSATVLQRYLYWGYGSILALCRAYDGGAVPATINSGVAIVTDANVADIPALTRDWDTLRSMFE